MKLQVRVQPKASRNAIEEQANGDLKVYVTAAPEGGKANDSVITLLAKHLGVPKRTLEIVRGHRSRDKVVEVRGERRG